MRYHDPSERLAHMLAVDACLDRYEKILRDLKYISRHADRLSDSDHREALSLCGQIERSLRI